MSKPDPTEAIPAYIGRKPCGCIVYIAGDDPNASKECKKSLANDIAKLIRKGITVERSTVGFVRKCKFGCECEPEKKPPRQKSLIDPKKLHDALKG